MPSTEYLRTPELAKRTGLSRRFFEKARLTGGGPPFIKINVGGGRGGAVLYDWAKVQEWLSAQECQSTSDPGHTV